MENPLLQQFIYDAESYLPTIRGNILVCLQEQHSGGELEISLRQIQAIRETAAMINLPEIEKIAENLEREFARLVALKNPLTDAQSRHLLDKLAQLEALLVKVHFREDDFAFDFADFVDTSFDNLQIFQPGADIENSAETASGFSEEATEDEFDGFEIDEEMLEIFALEAEDLLRNINTHLEVLESKPNDRDALLEIRRNAHTLKGSAGIVGLKTLSGLAHRVEDLLDFLSEKDIEGNEKIFQLLLTATDCLSAISSGENSPQLTQRIERLDKEFDRLLNAIQNGGAATKSLGHLPKTNAQIVKAGMAGEVQISKTKDQPVEEVQAPPSEIHNPKSVVRVSLEKLDDLVSLVSDLIISRSVFEQRLAELDRQIGELNHITQRLRLSTGKLETDYEASTLGTGGIGFPQSVSSSSQTFDALELDRYTDFHQTARELIESTGDTSAINTELDRLQGHLELIFDNQKHLLDEVQNKLLRLRMVPFSSLSARLIRTVRVTCEQEAKQAELVIEGEQTEIDTQILDALIEPLLHLLRNAVAHGIEAPDTRRLLGKSEKGKITLRLHSEGTHIVLTVTDDGRGISASGLKEKAVRNGFIKAEEAERMSDEEAFALAFLPGLTTAETISQTAGRGVGMNIIKTHILRRQGTITIDSEPQKGTTLSIRLPMALAVTRGLLVKTGRQTFAFPLKLVKQVGELSAEKVAEVKLSKTLETDESNYTVSFLNELLNLPEIGTTAAPKNVPLVLLETLETPCALLVDEVIKPEELVIKPLGAPLKNSPELLGATILGDGQVVPVLDLIYLLKNQVSNPKPQTTSPQSQVLNQETGQMNDSILTVMIVDDSPSVRHVTSNLVKKAGWKVISAKDGQEALEILQTFEELPNVVLTDVEMPRMDGYELLASIKKEEKLQTIPVVMITSRANEKHRQKAVELGVSDYLTKPFDDSVLIGTIKNLTRSESLS